MSLSYLLRVDLVGSRPKIWRRVFVPAQISLPELHAVLQVTMGWPGNGHWQFSIRRRHYASREMPGVTLQAHAGLGLVDLVQRRGSVFQYQCFFEDAWRHQITLSNPQFDSHAWEEKVQCVAGAGACPPADVGGIEGYYEFLRAIEDPEHPDHYEMTDWIGAEFDRDEFYDDRINADLRRLQDRLGPESPVRA